MILGLGVVLAAQARYILTGSSEVRSPAQTNLILQLLDKDAFGGEGFEDWAERVKSKSFRASH